MNLKKIGLALAASALILSGSGCSLFSAKKASPAPQAQTGTTEVQKAFDEFLMEETRRQLTQDALTLHFSLTDPAALGIREKPVTLGSLSEADELRHQQETEAALQNLAQLSAAAARSETNVSDERIHAFAISVRAEPRPDRRVKSELP